ncbi:MAG: hypothetical protein ACRCV9_19120, partial [Burkholderiaceae bacterium]
LERATDRLKQAVLVFEREDGSRVEMRGLGLTYGISGTLKAADDLMLAAKAERERAGLRAARGEKPPQVVEIGAPRNEAQGSQDTAGAVAGQNAGAGTDGQPGRAAVAAPGSARAGEAGGSETAAQAKELGRLTDAFAAARQQVDALQQAGAQFDQFSAMLNEVAPEVANLMVGLREAAGDPRRMRALQQLLAKQAENDWKPAADATADAVEGMRALTDKQLADMVEPPKPATAEHLRSVADRVQAIETETPDMPVRMLEDGTVLTAKEEMALARQQAAQGTDTELGALDADLVRVAADCFLSTGGM